jgi:4-hydroxybenzoyl-CoA reductase subunit beta
VEAARILAGEGPGTAIIAGGTDLIPNMKRRHQMPGTLVSLKRVPGLGEIRGDARAGLRLGPMTTLAAIARHPEIRRAWPAFAHAAGVVSTPILRNMGTIGGNLCLDTRCNYYDQNYEWRHAIDFCLKWEGAVCWVAPSSPRCYAVNSSDTAPVACALGARLRLVSAQGEREIAAQELYRMDGKDYLTRRPDEILAEIILPPADGRVAGYRKLARRGSFDFPVLGVAAALRREPDGTVREARIYLNAVASAPLRIETAEAALEGAKLTPESIERAAECAWRPAKPMDNTDLNYAWRKTMVKVNTRRLLSDLMEGTRP